MCSPNERRQRRRLHPPEQCDPSVEECLIRDIYPNPELKSEEGQRNVKHFLLLLILLIRLYYLKSLPAAGRQIILICSTLLDLPISIT